MSSPAAEIRALLALINTAAEDAIQQYESSGHGVPDIKEAAIPQLPVDTLKLKRSIRVLEGATQQLVATLTPPDLFVYTVSSAWWFYVASRYKPFVRFSGPLLLALTWPVSV